MYYGEFGYRYSHDAKDMPASIKNLLDSIRAHCSKPDVPLNSCLVARYKSVADHGIMINILVKIREVVLVYIFTKTISLTKMMNFLVVLKI